MRVLVVEDEQKINRIVCQALREEALDFALPVDQRTITIEGDGFGKCWHIPLPSLRSQRMYTH